MKFLLFKLQIINYWPIVWIIERSSTIRRGVSGFSVSKSIFFDFCKGG